MSTGTAIQSAAQPAAPFNLSARKDNAEAFDFEREVRTAWDSFPDIINRVFFLDIANQRLVYPGDKDSMTVAGTALNHDRGLLEEVRQSKEEKRNRAYPGKNGNYVLLYTKEDGKDLSRYGISREQLMYFAFDHEFAHAMMPGALDTKNMNLAECMADAYAVIRHFQRFGADSTAPDALMAYRAAKFVFRNDHDKEAAADHFTAPVLEQILARRHDIDWSKLTPQETRKLAFRFAAQYALHPMVLKAMDDSFGDFHGMSAKFGDGDYTGLPAAATTLGETKTPHVLQWGLLALRCIADSAPPVPGLDATLQQLGEKAKRDGDIFFGLGDAARPLKRPHPARAANQP